MQFKSLKFILVITAVFVLAALLQPFSAAQAQSTPPGPYDLIKAINNLRNTRGLAPLQTNSALMASAQAHSEYQASIKVYTHTGAGGTNETDRATAAGYGSGSISCDEVVAIAQAATTAEYIVNVVWKDHQHRDLVLLNSSYVDTGAGVTVGGDGLVYYTVVSCKSNRKGSSTPATTSSPVTPTAPLRTQETSKPVITVTAQENGAIVHEVEAGETIWSIAFAYGLSSDQLANLNGLTPQNPLIYAGQKLVVRPAFTPTLSPTITQTQRPPTRTPRPTFTPRPTRPTHTPTLSPTATPEPLVHLPKVERRWFGIGLIILCGAGLLSILVGNLRSTSAGKKKKS